MSPADNLCKQFRPIGMIWIQTAWHTTDITKKKKKNRKKKTTKKLILKKKSADDKTMANYLLGKKSWWIEMEGATSTCRFHA